MTSIDNQIVCDQRLNHGEWFTGMSVDYPDYALKNRVSIITGQVLLKLGYRQVNCECGGFYWRHEKRL